MSEVSPENLHFLNKFPADIDVARSQGHRSQGPHFEIQCAEVTAYFITMMTLTEIDHLHRARTSNWC